MGQEGVLSANYPTLPHNMWALQNKLVCSVRCVERPMKNEQAVPVQALRFAAQYI